MSKEALQELVEMMQESEELEIRRVDSDSLDEIDTNIIADMIDALKTRQDFLTAIFVDVANPETLANSGCLGEAVHKQCDTIQSNPEMIPPTTAMLSTIASIMGNLHNDYIRENCADPDSDAINVLDRNQHFFIGIPNHPKYPTAEEQFKNLASDPVYIAYLKKVMAHTPVLIKLMIESLEEHLKTLAKSKTPSEAVVDESDIYGKPNGAILH